MSTIALSADARLEAIREAVLEAYEADGYAKQVEVKIEGGTEVVTEKDHDALAFGIRDFLRKHAVARTQKEKEERAVKKTTLAMSMFPSLPVPGSREFGDDPDGIKADVWQKIVADVVAHVRSKTGARVQTLLAADSLILIEAKVRLEKSASVYVTDDRTLILLDFVGPRSAKIQHVAAAQSMDLGLVGVRFPNMKKEVEKKLEKGLELAAIEAKKTYGLITAGSPDDDES